MKDYQQQFIELLVRANALQFGTFTLKSGRVAPYFFNAGAFYTGELLHRLGTFYAQAYLDAGFEADVIFGPSYKGIPLCVVTTSVLYSQFQKDLSYAFNRKEAKDHGEGAVLVGAPLNADTRLLLIDDVITAGTAISEVVEILKANGNPKIVGVLIAMNRMEKNNDGQNALHDIEKNLNAPVVSVINLDHVIDYLYGREIEGKIYINDAQMEHIREYRAQYGV